MPQKTKNDTGSQGSREPVFLVLGKLRRAHGVHGEIPLEVYTNMLELLEPGSRIYIGDAHETYRIDQIRWKQDLLLLKLEGVDDRESISALTNQLVYVKSSEMPVLPEDEYYFHELIGLHVYEPEGHYLGVLEQILQTGANDVYLIRSEEGKEVLIPATEEMILEVQIAQQKMVVAKMKWYGEEA
jgi:16S rRNA processing protein RimM